MAKKQTKKKGGAPARQTGPVAALYGLDPGTTRGDAVRTVLAAQGFRVRTATADNLGDPVGSLVGMPGIKPSAKPFAGEAPDREFMLLHNVSPAKLNALLAAMREADCSVGCKAQVTPHNRLWPFATLVENVSREHEAMQAARE